MSVDGLGREGVLRAYVCHGVPVGSCGHGGCCLGSCLQRNFIACFADVCTHLYLLRLVVT